MVLSDIITTPFLIILAITLLLIIGFGIFFIQKIEYQNHKIKSMIDLVTTMAEEMNVIKGRMFLNHTQSQSQNIIPSFGGSNNNISLEQNKNSLIEVSDNDESDSDSDGESVCEDLEDESVDGSDSESDDGSESSPKEQIKHININYKSNDAETIDVEEILDETDNDSNSGCDLEELESLNSSESNDIHDIDDNIKSIDVLVESEIESEKINHSYSNNNLDIDILKTINISDFDNSETNNQITDYKKMPVNQLRNIAIEKGLINANDSNKLKKNEIIKLLQDK